jgi:hypothetical protein
LEKVAKIIEELTNRVPQPTDLPKGAEYWELVYEDFQRKSKELDVTISTMSK